MHRRIVGLLMQIKIKVSRKGIRPIAVATVAIDGAANAAILGAKMLSISDKDLRAKLKDYKKEMKDGVMAKAEKLDKLGHDKYIEQM